MLVSCGAWCQHFHHDLLDSVAKYNMVRLPTWEKKHGFQQPLIHVQISIILYIILEILITSLHVIMTSSCTQSAAMLAFAF